MAGYLLLRDNKESGPYTVDDLLQLGLKPYDLIWVPGKSAAWRYPSEIEELKSFAPAVEEQPFDRFYKKSTQEPSEEFTPTIQPRVTKEEISSGNDQFNRYAPPPAAAKQEEVPFTPKKSVFVTMPGQKQVVAKKETTPVQSIQPAKPVSPVPVAAPAITESPEVAEIKYSQPLDEIKERYVKQLLDRKDKKAKKVFVISALKKAAVVVGLIGLGLLAGYFFIAKPEKENTVAQQVRQSAPLLNTGNAAAIPPSTPSSNIEEQSTGQGPVEKVQDEEEQIKPQRIKEEVKLNEEQEPTTVRIRKETMLIVPKEKQEDFPARQPQFSQQPSETDPVTGERNARMRSAADLGFEEKAVMKPLRKNSGLFDLVSVTTNDYKRVAFGGIRNLYLTVTNNSKYELDRVIVELQYLKPSEEPLRTENIRFRTIAPNASATIRIPDTNRGIKVSYKIINIDSKQMATDGVALKY